MPVAVTLPALFGELSSQLRTAVWARGRFCLITLLSHTAFNRSDACIKHNRRKRYENPCDQKPWQKFSTLSLNPGIGRVRGGIFYGHFGVDRITTVDILTLRV